MDGNQDFSAGKLLSLSNWSVEKSCLIKASFGYERLGAGERRLIGRGLLA
jgi:hypothetical protein